jgi:Rrf2 family transcriptional regulator, cysteine metabolism repressor
MIPHFTVFKVDSTDQETVKWARTADNRGPERSMKFSSRAIYGMRAMLVLARAHGQGSVFLKDIVEREHLPGTYLEQLMGPLRKAGIVQGVRGARGGYTLARAPAEIPVLAILEALEGPLNLAECPGGPGCCRQPETCALQDLWAEGSRALGRIYQDLSLAGLLERQRAKEADPVQDYHI